MNTTISHELARTRIDDLHRRAARERLARAAATPSTAPRPHENRILATLRLRRAWPVTTPTA